MFEVGEYIVYNNNGICRIEEITHLNLSGADKDKVYYVLSPLSNENSKIYFPVGNTKVAVRKILTSEEANTLIDEIPIIEEFWAENDKVREEKYKEALKTCDCRQYVKIIKTLYLKNQERLAMGKKITTTDERYLKQAEEHLYSELAFSIGRAKDEMEAYITKRIEDLIKDQEESITP